MARCEVVTILQFVLFERFSIFNAKSDVYPSTGP